MLNEEKIRLMTKISIYEKNEEYGDLVLARYAKKGLIRYNRNLKRLITMEEREEVVNKYHDRIRVSTSIGGDSPELDEIINGKKPTE